MIRGTSSKPIDISGRGERSFYNQYKSIKENKKLGFFSDSEQLELLVEAIEELAKRDFKTARKLYSEDFKNLKLPPKIFYQKKLEDLLEIKN